MDNPSYYAIIPANVRYDKRLKANEKLLYGEITSLAQKNGICWATNEYFAELYDVRKEQISRWISNLVKFNYIKLKLMYKDDTKQIIGRYLSIIICEPTDDFMPPIAQKDNTSCVNTHDPHAEKRNTPIAQKRKDNSTSTEQYKSNNSTPLPPKGGLDENKKDEVIIEEQTIAKVAKPKPEFNYEGFNEIDKIAIKKWFAYRQEIKKPYKSQSGLTELRNTLLELKSSDSVVESINRSLTAEYRGVYILNSFKKNNSSPKKTGMYIDDFTINKPLNQIDTL